MDNSNNKISSPKLPVSEPATEVTQILQSHPNDEDETLTASDLNQSLNHHQHTVHRASAANFRDIDPQIHNQYRRIAIADQAPSSTDYDVTKQIREAIDLRQKWIFKREIPEWCGYSPPRNTDYTVFIPPPYDPFSMQYPPASTHVCHWEEGVVSIFEDHKAVIRRKPLFKSLSFSKFAEDLLRLSQIIEDPECRTFCYRRLMLLQERFNMYIILNDNRERLAQVAVPHRDIYNVRKVDVHGM